MSLPPVIIALGANLGDTQATLHAAWARLETLSARPLARSSFWVSTPVDCPPGSPLFLNAAAGLWPAPELTPEALLKQLKDIEVQLGRRPKVVLNEPRAVDLDLIAFGNEVRHTPELTLPHPRAHLRRFVLEPLAEFAADLVLPGQTRTVKDLVKALPPDPLLRRL